MPSSVLADCHRGVGEPQKSLDYWNRILDRDPRNKVILTRAGDAYRSMEDYANASEYYERALNIEFDVYAVLGLATISRLQGKVTDAIESLRRWYRTKARTTACILNLPIAIWP
jgi:tetratricopeptide (TPR) repeat protein